MRSWVEYADTSTPKITSHSLINNTPLFSILQTCKLYTSYKFNLARLIHFTTLVMNIQEFFIHMSMVLNKTLWEQQGPLTDANNVRIFM